MASSTAASIISTTSTTENTGQPTIESFSISSQLTSSSTQPNMQEEKLMHIILIILSGFVVSLVMVIIIINEISRYHRLTEKLYEQRSPSDPRDVISYAEISEVIPNRKQSNEEVPLCQENDSEKYQRQDSVRLNDDNVECDPEIDQDRAPVSFENDNIEKKAVVTVETENIDLSDDKIMITEQTLPKANGTKDSESKTNCVAEIVDGDIDIYSTVRK